MWKTKLFVIVTVFAFAILNLIFTAGRKKFAFDMWDGNDVGMHNFKCPSKRIITVIPGGRLGNLIWEYLSLFAVIRLYEDQLNAVAYVPAYIKTKLEILFKNLSIPTISRGYSNCILQHKSYTIQHNETVFGEEVFSGNGSIILGIYSSRYEDIIKYGMDKIKKELRFQAEYTQYAQKLLKEIRDNSAIPSANVTFVGMHYRGTDYITILREYRGYFRRVPTYKYYLKCMAYFKKRYSDIIFIFISIDYYWMKVNLPYIREGATVIVNPNDGRREQDLALLAHCNHSIINYGTFGAAAAVLAGGTTFAYNLGFPLDHRGPTISMGLASLLPNWYLVK